MFKQQIQRIKNVRAVVSNNLWFFLWLIGVFRIYKNGSGHSTVVRGWHPITWLLVVVFIPVFAFAGDRIQDNFCLRPRVQGEPVWL